MYGRDRQGCSGSDLDSGAWGDGRYLVLLLLIVVGLRAWQISHTEVTSRDSMLFVRMAWQMEHEGLGPVLKRGPHHPAYPLLVLAVSGPVRHFIADLPSAMQLSAQLASALASLLLIFPVYFYGRAFFGRRVAFWACLLFQCLPASGRVLGDGLSEGLFLLLAVGGLVCAVRALHTGSRLFFALCGLMSGLAYLTRPEGALIAASAAVVLLACQLRPSLRLPWKELLVRGAALSLAALAVAGPYMAYIGGITVKNSARAVIGGQHPEDDVDRLYQNPFPRPVSQVLPQRPGLALHAPLAIWSDDSLLSEENRTAWASRAFVMVLIRGYFHIAWLPALLGLWWFRDRFRDPASWVAVLACVMLVGLLFRVAQRMGYLSDRHLLLVILLGCFFACAALVRLGGSIAAWLSRRKWAPTGFWGSASAWSCGMLLVVSVLPLGRTLQPLHSERLGFRDVGRWLAENTRAGDLVIDPYAWAYYYAGRVFVEGSKEAPQSQPSRFYVVLEEGQSLHPHLLSLTRAREWAQQGQEIYRYQVHRGKRLAEIVVYQVPRPPQPSQSAAALLAP
jgi:hypothetical protein